MKQLFLALLTLAMLSCKEENKNNVIEGNIYLKLIDFHSLVYNLPDEKLKEFKNKIININQDNASGSEKKLVSYFMILIENNIFNKPHFKLKLESGKIINVYTNEDEYKKLSKELNNFDKYKEKISIKLKGIEIPNNILDADDIFNKTIFHAKEIISVEKTKGVTDWVK